MLLLVVKEKNGWLLSSWNLTYKVVNAVYDFYDKPEVLVDESAAKISSKDEILNVDEHRNMTIRGISKIIKAPLMILAW